MARKLVSGWRLCALAEVLPKRRYLTGAEAKSESRAWYVKAFFPPDRDDEFPRSGFVLGRVADRRLKRAQSRHQQED